jgi:hypothetical protein
VSSDPAHLGDSPAGAGESSQAPSEAELRAAYEAELSRITPGDVMMQAAVSLLNLGARRLGLTAQPEAGSEPTDSGPAEQERDLGQVRDAIDGVRAMLAILERSVPGELRPLRDALSQLQIAYAREAPAGAEAGRPPEQARPAAAGSEPNAGEQSDAPGPAQSSGRLWVPGS